MGCKGLFFVFLYIWNSDMKNANSTIRKCIFTFYGNKRIIKLIKMELQIELRTTNMKYGSHSSQKM